MTAITTVAELEALPDGAFVRDSEGDEWRKRPSALWCVAEHPSTLGVLPEHLLKAYGPLCVESDDAPVLHMTCCVSDGCMTSHPLPPGSSWACPEHTTHLTVGSTR
jgi:hypothetical protein